MSKLTSLERLHLDGTSISDLSTLGSLSDLEEIHLFGTQVSDLSQLEAMQKLREAELGNTKIDDVSNLTGLRHLEYLNISNTLVNDLRPLLSLEQEAGGTLSNLSFQQTAASQSDPEVHRLSLVSDPRQRTMETLVYLRTTAS